LLLRMLGVAVVRKDGARASRLRVFWRSLVAWSPVWCAPVLFALFVPLLAMTRPPVVPKPMEARPPELIAVPSLPKPVAMNVPKVVEAPPGLTNTPAVTNAPVAAPAPASGPVGGSLPPGLIWCGSLLALLAFGLTLLSLALPGRSLQDRIAGTCLVPR